MMLISNRPVLTSKNTGKTNLLLFLFGKILTMTVRAAIRFYFVLLHTNVEKLQSALNNEAIDVCVWAMNDSFIYGFVKLKKTTRSNRVKWYFTEFHSEIMLQNVPRMAQHKILSAFKEETKDWKLHGQKANPFNATETSGAEQPTNDDLSCSTETDANRTDTTTTTVSPGNPQERAVAVNLRNLPDSATAASPHNPSMGLCNPPDAGAAAGLVNNRNATESVVGTLSKKKEVCLGASTAGILEDQGKRYNDRGIVTQELVKRPESAKRQIASEECSDACSIENRTDDKMEEREVAKQKLASESAATQQSISVPGMSRGATSTPEHIHNNTEIIQEAENLKCMETFIAPKPDRIRHKRAKILLIAI